MLDRLGIRGKVLAVVAVPILVLILAAGVIVWQAAQSLGQARDAERVLDVLGTIQEVQTDFQNERWAATNFVHSVQDGESKLETAYEATDAAIADLEARAEAIEPDELTGVLDGPSPEELMDEVDAAINRGASGLYMEDARALGVGAPTEESAGWVVFPGEDDIAAMQAAYTAAAEEVSAIADSLPESYNMDVPLAALSFRLNNESEFATTLFTEPVDFRTEFEQAATATNAAVEKLGVSSDLLQVNADNEQALAVLAEAEQALAQLPAIRASVADTSVNVAYLTNFYTGVVDSTVRSSTVVGVTMEGQEVVQGLQAYASLDTLVERIKFEETVTQRLIRAGAFAPGEIAQARTMTTRTDIALEAAQDASQTVPGTSEVPNYGGSAADNDGTADSFVSVRTQVLTGLDASLIGERDADWPAQVGAELEVYEPLRADMWDYVESEAAAARQAAVWQTVLTALVAVIVIGTSLVVALLIARRIVGPMRRLTTTATAVRTELPRLVERVAVPGEDVDVSEVQIPVESQDEVGRLAEAFNAVNATTLSIASEQAALRGSISEMFVNVARRDQVLLNRQLASIDDMERTEDDPDTLTKLFALDHLATRMRRNSESLLVLAGIDTGRRLRRPMPLSDVVRTASSEIELYERVELELHEDPAMLGHAALTTAHLFAELLENATVFSDPGSRVAVTTTRQGDSYRVEIADDGIGMTDSEVADANARVASTAASEILGAQRLGLFVVGRIARRVGATVSIASREGEGTVATVLLPVTLFASDTDAAPVDMPPVAASAPSNVPSQQAPATAPVGGSAYAPAAVEQGTSLSGRSDGLPARGDGLPARSGALPTRNEPAEAPANSIDDLIAADAAAAPVAEATNPEALTDGNSAAGLPSRRRRTAPGVSDAERERNSVVGLPARATDEQLSALAAEAGGGFTPAVAASEISPESLEERSSMFRGFRSRRDNEDAQGQTPATPLPSRPKVQSAPEIPGFAPSAPEFEDRAPAQPTPEPQDNSGRNAAITGTAAAGAAAFTAAAFFGGRDRSAASAASAPEPRDAGIEPVDAALYSADQYSADQAAEPSASVPEPEPTPTYELEPDAAAGVAGFRMPKLDSVYSAQSALSAQSAVVDEEPAVAEEPVVAEEPAAAAVTPAEPDAAPQMPSFLAEAPAVRSAEEPWSAVEPAAADAPVDPAPYSVPEVDSAPEAASSVDAMPEVSAAPADAFVVPMLEEDEPQAEEVPAFSPATNPFAPVFAAEAEPQPASSAPEIEDREPAYEPWEQQAPAAQEPQAPHYGSYDSPAAATPAAPFQPEPQQQSPFGAAPLAPTPWTGSGATDSPTGSPVSAASADAPQLDALIQSAVEEDHKPGFFSRLFGRGPREDKVEQVAESPASAAGVSFNPIAAAPHSSARSAASAPEPSMPPARPSFMPSAEAAPSYEAPAAAPSASGGWAPQATPSQPEPEPAPFVPSAPEPVSEAPQAFEPAPQSFQPAPQSFEPAPQAFEPAPQSFEPAPQAFQPEAVRDQWGQSESADEGASFSPDDLARATGWEAAGQSAIQAAEPEVSSGYQPIIQPEPLPDDEPDMTSAVFSELSSLAAERPKVEKTRAGLQKRRPADAPPVEVKPLAAEPTATPSADRDAEAVRHRFSSFYSGTQRARSDVEAMDRDSAEAGRQE
ncbi:ATP-binding protein [Demequina sp. B12]|uniref:HAMP domain-containing sensor histidine kinase n=1 Tax=Demequina sp. B12 TaxID=2992757 RepID=UPI00237A0F06|nr:ATP-binding protein [Demequina sp. B12]MDE0572020.1 ATP-binding protein [Demequina sp. B12]